VDKRYVVGVAGRFRNELQRVCLALAKRVNSEGEKRVSVSAAGQEAETIFRRIDRGAQFSLLEAQLLTGRTHQIRVHLAHLKHPILGDDKYGDFELNRSLRKLGLNRMFLHAASLALRHPLTGEPLSLTAPLPAELERFRQGHMTSAAGAR
jgi:23S rRNA pseudouridine955/2504/2580 synthase